MISKEEVEHIAKLARLELTQDEIVKMQKDLSDILDYFNLLKKAPTVKAGYSNVLKNTEIINSKATRKDEVVSSHKIADELIAAAPDKKDDYIKVKAIL